jgi:hypothetical protein
MFIDGRLPLPIQAAGVLRQEPTDGDLGLIGIGTAIFLGAGGLIASLLGGGWLWTKHEELELEEEFNKWRKIYQDPPYNMTAEEAIAAARGELPTEGFNFGLNAPTVILVAGSLFALYVGSQVLVKWLSPGKK